MPKHRTFAGARRAIRSSIGKGIGQFVNDLQQALSDATPIDTTNAQNSWIAGVEPVNREIFIPQGDNERDARLQNATQQKARQDVGRAKMATLKDIPKRPIAIVNGASYITDLNEGRSPQQPFINWVGLTIRRRTQGKQVPIRR